MVSALAALFRALQAEGAAPDPGPAAEAGAPQERRVVAPSALREALSALPDHRFSMGADWPVNCRHQ